MIHQCWDYQSPRLSFSFGSPSCFVLAPDPDFWPSFRCPATGFVCRLTAVVPKGNPQVPQVFLKTSVIDPDYAQLKRVGAACPKHKPGRALQDATDAQR
jgi:hypothetical protein